MAAVQRMCGEGDQYPAPAEAWKSSWAEGRENLMTLSAPLTILCRAFLSDTLQLEYHVEIQYVRTLSTAPL